MARLVLNHSTHIEGLIKSLKIMSREKRIKTITPANISKANSNIGRLTIRVTRETKEGYKLIARKGHMTQAVFLVTNENEDFIKELIKKSLPSRYRKN